MEKALMTDEELITQARTEKLNVFIVDELCDRLEARNRTIEFLKEGLFRADAVIRINELIEESKTLATEAVFGSLKDK